MPYYLDRVDIADSNQLPLRKPFGFTLPQPQSSTSGIRLPVCCPIYTNIIFRTKLSSRTSANKLDYFLERPLRHDCSQLQLFVLYRNFVSNLLTQGFSLSSIKYGLFLIINSIIYLYIRTGTLIRSSFLTRIRYCQTCGI